MPELVSAILPTYNRAALLLKALDSVIAQTYRPIQAVIIDDGSTDRTHEAIEEYKPVLDKAGISLLVHQQKNERAPKARNIGMKLAGGSLFAFLDSDDLWMPTCVATQAGLMEKYPSAGLAFVGILGIDDDGNVFAERNQGLPKTPPQGLLPTPFNLIMRHMPLQTSGVMVRRSAIDAVGDFDLDLPVVEDWDLWYRISKKFDFAYSTQPLACNRSHPKNLPKNDTLALSGKIKMNTRHLPDITDPQSRAALVHRLQKQMTLLQEQILREGKVANGLRPLLMHEVAPQTTRFKMGTIMQRTPLWMGRGYANAIRALGNMTRPYRPEDPA